MKSLLISLIFTTSLIGAMVVSNVKIPVKYSQYFADRQITLTESFTLGEKILFLPKKKGFVCFEE